ncbi:MAG: hypothetical protein VXX04_00890 [Actinomycetota bacterium]|nr:hypothetical protein [Actinomycetota bacterium]
MSNAVHNLVRIQESYEDFPQDMRDKLDSAIESLNRGDRYKHVNLQGGKRDKFYGWVVQKSFGGKIVRLGLCSDPKVGAMMAVLSHVDERLRTQRAMHKFLNDVVADATVWDAWAKENDVDAASFPSPKRYNIGGRPLTKVWRLPWNQTSFGDSKIAKRDVHTPTVTTLVCVSVQDGWEGLPGPQGSPQPVVVGQEVSTDVSSPLRKIRDTCQLVNQTVPREVPVVS